MPSDNHTECHEMADGLPVVPGLDLDATIQMVRLYLGTDETMTIVDNVAQILVDTARGLETPFVGQIWVATWGYEQTNVDYFEAVKTTAKTVHIAPINKRITKAADFSGNCIPLRSRFVEGAPVQRRRLSASGDLRIDDCRRAVPWNARANSWSSYA